MTCPDNTAVNDRMGSSDFQAHTRFSLIGKWLMETEVLILFLLGLGFELRAS
jgi:hypothetical protein